MRANLIALPAEVNRHYVSDAHDGSQRICFHCPMANPWGPKLSCAIRERSYSSAALARKTKEVASLEEALDTARRDLKAIQDCLAELDRQIAALSAIDVSAIRRINRFPKSGLFRHGELAAAIVHILKAAPGPLATPVIITLVGNKLGLPTESSDDWTATRLRVKKQLQAYAKKGAVERLHDLEANEIGAWRWVGI